MNIDLKSNIHPHCDYQIGHLQTFTHFLEQRHEAPVSHGASITAWIHFKFDMSSVLLLYHSSLHNYIKGITHLIPLAHINMRFFHFFITASIAFAVFAQVCTAEGKEHSEIVPLTKRALVEVTEDNLKAGRPYTCTHTPGKKYFYKPNSKRELYV